MAGSPTPEQIIYRANILIGETDAEAQRVLETLPSVAGSFPPRATVREALRQLDRRNLAGEARPAMLAPHWNSHKFLRRP